jgi:aerobic carbon-monoxide dehydrogenase medium subunit
MIAQEFDYQAPLTLSEALQALSGDRVKPLAGGMSLIPMMKLRLAAPEILVDLHHVAELRSIKLTGAVLSIGAMVTHYELESTPLVRSACPLLAAVAARIGDVQVRNRGTIGGAIAHCDPAADYPAALLAIDTVLKLASARGERTVPAAGFFLDPFTTALEPGELITGIQVPAETEGTGVAYEKHVHPASGFAVVGVAVRVNRSGGKITNARIGITGVSGTAYRAAAVEQLMEGREGTAEEIRAAAAVAADGIDASSDIHASADYRSHLARVLTARAINIALGKAA